MPVLFDPRKPWLWKDGTPRSQDNGFTMGWSGEAVVTDLAKQERAKRTAVRQVAKMRAQGRDQSVFSLKYARRKKATER